MVYNSYFLLIKSADAERRAWKNLKQEKKEFVFPLVELTRGRKKRGAGKELKPEQLKLAPNIYNFDKNCRSILGLMSSVPSFFVDLTREPELTCHELEALATSDGAYKAWVDFVIGLKKEYAGILPTILVNPSEGESEEEHKENLLGQFGRMSSEFGCVAYRVSVLEDQEFLLDLALLKDEIERFSECGGRFYVFLDHEFIRPGSGEAHAKRSSVIVSSVYSEIPSALIVSLATSFPKNVTDIGDEDHDMFRVEEMFLYEKLRKIYPELLYGDYGSINPIRNDEVVMTRGWRPRVDYVSTFNNEFKIFYFREKRKIIGQKVVLEKGVEKKKNVYAPYSEHYALAAKDVVGCFPYFEKLEDSWGCGEVENAAGGNVSSSSPSYWISVRMEVYINQVLRYLGRG